MYIESDEFEVADSDSPDVKLSKDSLTELRKNLSDYKAKKSLVDNIYKGDYVKEDELEKIIGVDEDKNPFLLSYANVEAMKRKIEDSQKSGDKKSLELSDFKDRLSIATTDLKVPLSKRVSEIEEQKSKIESDIIEDTKKFKELEIEHNEKMKNVENDLKEWIKNIQ